MANQIGFSEAMKEVVGNNFVTLEELKNDNEIYFPLFKDNANGTEAKKILGKLIANNSGGGSTPSAQPDRVIIIDTTLTENIEGKAYSTFASAKAYMETYPEQKFCVELPAGNFDDENIELDSHWVINGNNTIITKPISSTDYGSQDTLGENSNIRMKNCIISAGFISSSTEPTTFSLFYLLNCVITNASCGMSPVAVICNSCVLKSDVASNAIIVAFSSVIQKITSYTLIAISSSVDGVCNIAISSMFNGCNFSELSEVMTANTNTFIFCQFTNGFKSNNIYNICKCSGRIELTGDTSNSYIEGSDLTFTSATSRANGTIDIKNSSLYLEGLKDVGSYWVHPFSSLRLNYNSELLTLVGTPNSNIYLTDPASVSIKNYAPLTMYSTDGGSTMTSDPENATHIGINRNPNDFAISPSPIHYVWIPLS